jgi:hypothetical protein
MAADPREAVTEIAAPTSNDSGWCGRFVRDEPDVGVPPGGESGSRIQSRQLTTRPRVSA